MNMGKIILTSLLLITGSIYCYYSDPLDSKFHTPMYIAAIQGNLQEVKDLVASGADINGLNDSAEPEWWDYYDDHAHLTPLHGAIFGENIEITNFLIGHGADLNPRRGGSILEAAARHMPTLVDQLIRHGARDGYQEALSLLVVSHEIDADSFKVLLEYRHSLLDDNKSRELLRELLIGAVNNKYSMDMSKIALLIDEGIDLRGDWLENHTPLHYLASFKQPSGLVWPNTPEEIAKREEERRKMVRKKIEAMQLIIDKGGDLNDRNTYGKTPFEYAQEPEIIEFLSLMNTKL